jgi:hypothetical protein
MYHPIKLDLANNMGIISSNKNWHLYPILNSNKCFCDYIVLRLLQQKDKQHNLQAALAEPVYLAESTLSAHEIKEYRKEMKWKVKREITLAFFFIDFLSCRMVFMLCFSI